MWRTIYLSKLPGLDRKVRVALDWTLDLLLEKDLVQLQTEPSGSREREAVA
jgi:NADH dehydrogenase